MGLYISISNSIGASAISGGARKPTFEFTINTANTSAGSTANNQFKLPLVSSLPLDAKVDWGDGSSDTITVWNQAETTHTYASSGTYTVSITGDLSGWQFDGTGDRLKMLEVTSWETLTISTNRAFRLCANLTATATNAPTITTSDMNFCFSGCSNFNGQIGNWNMSNVTTLISFLSNCTSFNQPIGDWDVSNVTDLSSVFNNARVFNQPIGNWDVSNVVNVNRMFLDAFAFNQDIGAWDVSNISDFQLMFYRATAFNNGLSDSINNWKIKTSGVVLMNEMFSGSATSNSCKFNQPIATKVVNAGLPNEYMAWDTSSVTDMSGMFARNTAFNQNIGNWNVSAVTSFASMFSDATAFNNGGSDDIDNWTIRIVSAVNMSSMFGGTSTGTSCKFNRYIGDWNTSAVNNMSSMFLRNTAFNQNIGSWNTGAVTNMSLMFAVATAFNQNIGAWNTSAVTNMSSMFDSNTVFNQNIASWNTSAVTDMSGMFQSASVFNQNIGSWDVSNVTTFLSMFNNATAFNNGGSADINNWTIRTASAVNMSGMFGGGNLGASCKFNQPIGNWDTSAVTNMSSMFNSNTVFNQNIGSWNTSAVTSMNRMFNNATAFNQNIGAWNVSSVTDFTNMFWNNTAFNNGGSSDINNWTLKTTGTVTMFAMFLGTPFNQPLNNWNTIAVTNMAAMFYLANSFNQDISSWNVSNVTNFTDFMLGKTAANYSAANLDSIYNGWSSRPVKPNISITFGTIKYTAAGQAGKDILTNAPNLWTCVDGGI